VGEGRKKTEIQVPAAADLPEGAGCVDDFSGQKRVSGICVVPAGEPGPGTRCENSPPSPGVQDEQVIRANDDVEISRLSVTGFTGDGILYFCADDPEVTRVLAKGADGSGYAIATFASEDIEITRNLALNGEEAGIYIGDSPHADAVVWKNVTWNNGFGLFIRDAAHGTIQKNKSFGNCLGVLFLNIDESQAPPDAHVPVIENRDWLAKHNNVTANNRACPASDEGPPVSGIGFAVIGAIDIHIIDNGVFGNDSSAESVFGGGIVVAGLPPETAPARGTKVGFNTVHGNSTDLFWDQQPPGGGGNAFFGNDCLTSNPDGLCEDPDDNGDHGDDGDRGDDHPKGGDDHHKGDRHENGHHKKHAKHHKKKHHKKHKSKKHHRDD
jgi:hypothetical protein